MKIVLAEGFFSVLKNHYLLLDTSAFIDTSINPTEFGKFFDQLKSNGVTLISIDSVIIEFLKGSLDSTRLAEKQKLVDEMITTCLPITKDTVDNIKNLLSLYKEDGKAVSITDLMLGGTLMQYKRKLLLLTKNIVDFPTNIFNLETYLNLIHRKAIQSYGVYSYP